MQTSRFQPAYFVFAALLAIGAGGAVAQPATTGHIVVEQPWTRATPKGADIAAGYFTVANAGSEPDRLVGASSPRAGRVEMHEMTMEGGIMKMRPVAGGIEIKPGQKVEFKPSGYHLMFMKLSGPLKQGETLNGELKFEKAGSIAVGFKVESIGAQGPGMGGHIGH